MTGGRIRRGVMATDHFTQIANALFRDHRLSFKAKGLFGYIASHQNGWEISVAGLVRCGPDGRDAVRTGLKELEAHGYLVRERLRRTDGTLGEVVYCITDRPTFVDALVADAATALHAPAPPSGRGRGVGGLGVRRGVMAGDQFTQVANGLFRHERLSFKAKGLFGLISTHREGWRMTVTDLARRGRDGAHAVASGLAELERYGFLQRERDRKADGTLGAAAYVITDLPALQNPSSRPESGNPGLDDPTLAHCPTKNTIVKKTNQQNTSPLPPCPRAERTPGVAAALPEGTGRPPALEDPGTRLLLSIGSAHPELLLQEKALHDQGRVVTAMLEAGWSAEQLRHVITGRPLPERIRTSVDAIVAARLRSAQLYPPPVTAAATAADSTGRQEAVAWTVQPHAPAAADRTVEEAITYRALVECSGCGRPGTAPGEDLCPACLNWPPCRTCPGPTPRRAHPDGDGCCSTCTTALTVTDLLEANPS